jgi:hypothetical protein
MFCVHTCVVVCAGYVRSLGGNGVGAAGAAAIGAGLVHLSQLQSLRYVVCKAVRAGPCTGKWGDAMRSRLCCCVCCLRSCSLGNNCIGAAGAAAIGAALVHLPQLLALEYVVCPAVRARSLCTFAPERGAMLVFTIVLLCVRPVFMQPWTQRHRCRGCDGHWCRPGPLAPAADTEVRCVPVCACEAVV